MTFPPCFLFCLHSLYVLHYFLHFNLLFPLLACTLCSTVLSSFLLFFHHSFLVAVALRNQKVSISSGNGRITEVANTVAIPTLSQLTICFEVQRNTQKQVSHTHVTREHRKSTPSVVSWSWRKFLNSAHFLFISATLAKSF